MLSIGSAIGPAWYTILRIVHVTSLWNDAQGGRRVQWRAGPIPINRVVWSVVLQDRDFLEGTVDSYRVRPQPQEVQGGSVPLRVVKRSVASRQDVRRFS
jgi:hypothetical protein